MRQGVSATFLSTLLLLTGAFAPAQERTSKIDLALAAPVDADFADAPLSDVIRTLGNLVKTSIVIDQLALDEVWTDPTTTKVTFQAKQTPLAETLDAILKPHELVWIERHEVLFVTTPAAAAERFAETQIYKLKRKVAPARRAEAIRTSVAPESWKLAGGKGDLSALPPSYIVILQSPVVHRQIAASFAQSLTPVEPSSDDTFSSPALDKALKSRDALSAKDESVVKLLNRLAKKHRLDITIDDNALKSAETNASELKTTLEVTQPLSMASLISLVVELTHGELVWLPSGDKIVVTTKTAAMTSVSAKTYDVKELTTVVDAKYLVEAIEYTIHPATWEFGGGEGKIELNEEGKLIVQQAEPVHRELRRFLQALQQSAREK